MFDKAKAVETARKALTRQQATLKQTLDELDFIMKSNPNATALITKIRTRRDRQASAVAATEQLIEMYEPALPGLEEKKKR